MQEYKNKLSRVLLWEIYVPRGFSVEHHREWDKKVIQIAGGLSILSPIKGKWLDETEGMIPVRIACTEYSMLQIMQMTKEHYDQKAIFVSYVSEAMILSS